MIHEHASDLDSRTTSFERAVSDFDYFAYETFGNSTAAHEFNRKEARELINTLRAVGGVGLSDYLGYAAEKRSRGPFQGFLDRLDRAMALSPRTTSMAIDVRLDGTELERQLYGTDLLWEEGDVYGRGKLFGAVANRAYGAMTANRDWILLATLGVRLQRLFGDRIHRPIEISTIMGNGHRDVTRKLTQSLGVSATSILWNSDRLADVGSAAGRVAQTTVADEADAHTLGYY